MTIPYTICFVRRGDYVLMLLRYKPPNAGLWNGLGGKIAVGETPAECARREVLEETGVDLSPEELRFGGVVRWSAGVDPTGPSTGMYAFVAELSDDRFVREDAWEVDEGLLSWKSLEWVCGPRNETVVSNVPRFLPGLLDASGPKEFRCRYEDGELASMAVRPM